MKRLILCLAFLLASCGSGDDDSDDGPTDGDTKGTHWWFEIDVLDFDRGEGNVVVRAGNQIEANSLGDNGEFSLTTTEVSISEPGSYEALS